MATVHTPRSDSTDTVHEPHNTASRLPAEGSPAMTAAVYIRMPASMLEAIEARAAAQGQAPARWVRTCVARSLRHPLQEPRGRQLLKPGKHLQSLVGLQEAVADLGLRIQARPAACAMSAILQVPEAAFVVSELRRISRDLVFLIDEVRR